MRTKEALMLLRWWLLLSFLAGASAASTKTITKTQTIAKTTITKTSTVAKSTITKILPAITVSKTLPAKTITATQPKVTVTATSVSVRTLTVSKPASTVSKTETQTSTAKDPFATELVVNGGFQQDNIDPSGWAIRDADDHWKTKLITNDGQNIFDAESFAIGQAGQPPPVISALRLTQPVDLVPGKTYLFSAWVLMEVLGGADKCLVEFYIAESRSSILASRSTVYNEEPSWQRLTTSFVAGEGSVHTLTARFTPPAPGWCYVDVDDVSIQLRSA